MQLTKYAHACVALENSGRRLVVDPGNFTPDYGGPLNVAAVVVTHVHQDHYNAAYLDEIFAANPDAVLYTTQEVADQYRKGNIVIVRDKQVETIGPFKLAFSVGLHALIHQSMPQIHNVAVCVNDTFFYPGDSYTAPALPVGMLAVPGNAPWMRISESMDYITQVKPKRCFATHDALLSDIGHTIYNGALQSAADAAGVEFISLNPGDSTDI